MPEQSAIVIEGLTQFRRALKSISAELPKMLKQELKEAAAHAEFVAVQAYSRRYASRSGRTIRSIKIRATSTGVALAFGGPGFPYVGGQEFGAVGTVQFRPYTGRGPGGRGSRGRFIFPAVRGEGPEVIKELEDRLARLAKRAYPDP